MANEARKAQNYSRAASYDSLEKQPQSRLCQDLVRHALGNDCTGQVILDLGGGSGLHARNAVKLGAARVDNVDISREMLDECEKKEISLGRTPGERIALFQGDVATDLDYLGLKGRDGSGLYDVVMVIWTFDHAATLAELEGIWENVGRYCRTGGKVISIRPKDPFDWKPSNEKYGVVISDVQSVPGGCRFVYTVQGDDPFSCEVTAMEAHYDLDQAREMAKRYGFSDLEVVPVAEMPEVKNAPDFWQDFVDSPGLICVTGTKVA